MPFNFNEIYRSQKIIKDTIALLEVDLEGLVVLTEVGSNSFIYTPLIALMANAKHVYAWTKDTSYGKGEDIVAECIEIAGKLGLDTGKLTFAINERPAHHVSNTDIITNSGMLRPLDKELLVHANKKPVIPLMFESWEWRPGEIDKEYCEEKGIKIGGTWENYPGLEIFNYSGVLGIKMIHESGLEVFKNKILVWSNDHFGDVITETLKACGAEVILTSDPTVLMQNLADLDGIFICDFHDTRQIIGLNGLIDVELLRQNPTVTVIHLCGAVDVDTCLNNNISVYPHKSGKSTFMTYTLAHVGLSPILKLQTAGLKVGELLCKGNEDHPLCQRIL